MIYVCISSLALSILINVLLIKKILEKTPGPLVGPARDEELEKEVSFLREQAVKQVMEENGGLHSAIIRTYRDFSESGMSTSNAWESTKELYRSFGFKIKLRGAALPRRAVRAAEAAEVAPGRVGP